MPRLISLIVPALIGGALGASAFLASDPSAGRVVMIDSLAHPARAPRVPETRAPRQVMALLDVLPLVSPTEASAPQAVLSGVVLRPVPKALVSLSGAPARWLRLGDTADGVKLIAVATDHVQLDTSAGLVTAKLSAVELPQGGQRAAASSPAG